MADEAEKLRRFREAVCEETRVQAERMLEEAKAEHDAAVKAARTDTERRRRQMESEVNAHYEHLLSCELSNAALVAKRTTLLRREELADSVFELVKEKLREFRASDKYIDWLCRNVDSVKERYKGHQTEVRVSAEDLPRLKGRLEAAADPSVTLGGAAVCVSDSNILLDFTFDSLLERERADFCRNAGL